MQEVFSRLSKGGAYWETAQKSGQPTSVNHNGRIKNESTYTQKAGKKPAWCFLFLIGGGSSDNSGQSPDEGN